jgi:bacteriocin-like protein
MKKMKKSQVSLLKAQSLSKKEMKNITGGTSAIARPYFCIAATAANCIPYNTKAECIASGCPSTKCYGMAVCIDLAP